MPQHRLARHDFRSGWLVGIVAVRGFFNVNGRIRIDAIVVMFVADAHLVFAAVVIENRISAEAKGAGVVRCDSTLRDHITGTAAGLTWLAFDAPFMISIGIKTRAIDKNRFANSIVVGILGFIPAITSCRPDGARITLGNRCCTQQQR